MNVTYMFVKQVRILGSRLGTMTDAVAAARHLDAGRFRPLVGAVLREIQGTSAELPAPSVDPMPRLFARQVRPWRLGSLLLSLFGALGLLLAAIGAV